MSRAPRETRLSGGLRVLTWELPETRSAAAGLYLPFGSRDEGPAEGGLTHLLEHLLFKGTRARADGSGQRGLREIACEIDALGAGLDAWTRREALGLEIEVLPEALPRALDLLGDLLLRPALEPGELEREREVIREEIRSVEDDPLELVDDLWAAWSWPEHPLGRPILGTEAELDSRGPGHLRAFHAARVRGAAVLACAAGPVRHEDLVAAWRSALEGLPPGRVERGPAAPPPRRGCLVRRKDSLGQAQLVLSLPGLRAGDPRQPALDLLLVLLGEGNSSRLWQRVREEAGLAYDVGAASVDLRDGGRVLVEAAAEPGRLRPILRLVHEELDSLRREGPREEELERARLNLRTGAVLAHEGAGAHLDAMVEDLLAEGEPVSLEAHLARLDAATREQVHALARELFGDPRRGLVVLGPPDTPRLGDDDLGSVSS